MSKHSVDEFIAEQGEECLVTRMQTEPDFSAEVFVTYGLVLTPQGKLARVERPFRQEAKEAIEEGKETGEKLATTISRGAAKTGQAIVQALDATNHAVLDRVPMATASGIRKFRTHRRLARLERIQRANERREEREAREKAEEAAKAAAEQAEAEVLAEAQAKQATESLKANAKAAKAASSK